MKDDLKSIQIERHCLGGLIKYPSVISEIDNIIEPSDFTHKVHEVIFSVTKEIILKNEPLDKVIIANKIKNLNIAFKDDINIFDYVDDLTFTQINEHAAIQSFKELKKLRVLRELCKSAKDIHEFVRTNKDKTIDEIIGEVDKILSDKVHSFSSSNQKLENIFDDMEFKIEEIGSNPPDPKTLLWGPMPTINKIFGPLLVPQGINLVGARTGAKKTSLGMAYLLDVAEKFDIPILHLDFAEMPKDVLQMRAVCYFTKDQVPFHAVKTGEWRKNAEWTKLVRGVWPRIKKLNMTYYNIGNFNQSQIFSLIRRFSYSKVGRGNPFLIHYDYLKPFDDNPFTPEWKEMGHFVQRFKDLLANLETASAWMSLQLNKSGITTNKNQREVDDSENSFSISDRIIQQVDFAWILREKLLDELEEEEYKFGNLKFIPVKARYLGQDPFGYTRKVKCLDDKYRKNYINLHSEIFHFEEKGDLRQMLDTLSLKKDLDDGKPKEELL